MKLPLMDELRKEYHQRILESVLRFNRRKKTWNNTDSSSTSSVENSAAVVERMKQSTGVLEGESTLVVQQVGKNFEKATMDFLEKSFSAVSHLRPGCWDYTRGGKISRFNQYAHLVEVNKALKENSALRSAFGDYIVTPDIVVSRLPETDDAINMNKKIVGASEGIARKTPLRESNAKTHIMHASVSCKWTLRSDRAQNARTEGLNLVRNRNGATPHIVVVVGEPVPARITPLAFGTGDIDCVYHFALTELCDAVGDKCDILNALIAGGRLRDISDLPFDLAI